MKAEIHELWQTGRKLVGYEGSDGFERPQTFSDLKQCENVILGDKIPGSRCREVLIDDEIVIVEPRKVYHRYWGTMYILEIF